MFARLEIGSAFQTISRYGLGLTSFSRGSMMDIIPVSVKLRISPPTPCFNFVTISGTITFISASGDTDALYVMMGSGTGNGSLKITRLDRLLPPILIPSQWAPVPSSTESVLRSNSCRTFSWDEPACCIRIS